MRKKKVPSMVKDQQLIKKRREQMIKGAVNLFKEKGFHRTTTREIAKESGFSIGTLYEYIGSKEDVLYLVCDAIYEEVRDRLKQYLDNDSSGIDRLKQAIASYFKVVDEMKDEVLVMYQEAKSLPKEALPYVLQKENEMTEMIESIVRDCVEDGLLDLEEEAEIKLVAHNILVQGHMWTFRRWVLKKQFTLEQYTELQIEHILKGIIK
ncbi:TetR/AcrR family transcriptional regulator [Alkalihalobacterium chitinilyticum]|uniref:TetR/AcrR family transcriptional regulator n=1 Tax=Alkalihalobacterium chitinilyticum TaxID=2980103 RepID=A0ABT5VGU9_9BACI|nr:TetR/AcrR family transcriptional regulator [Alkalihalobacterium chitinilyticum]MDE5414666.1 TetR/AcrR family transcriptional regulator [Alkalihalobacterium chitinilyticum]